MKPARHRKTYQNDPDALWRGSIIVGAKEAALPEEAVISLTLGERLPLWRTLLNSLLNQLALRQLVRSPDLLYVEVVGDLKEGFGYTMTVWKRGRAMAEFRDNGGHGWIKRFMSWVFYLGKSHAYFLTYPAQGREIPTLEEGRMVLRAHGRFLLGGRLVRPASRPTTARWAI